MIEGLYKILKIAVQISSISFTIFWAYFYIDMILDETVLSPVLVLEGIFVGIIINLGLWLTTQTFGKKHKFLTIFLLVPSIVLNSFLPIENSYFSLILGLIINICALIILFEGGKYPGYTIAEIDKIATPKSKRDGNVDNNLG